MSEVDTLHTPFASWLRSEGIEFIRARSDKPSTIEKGWCDFSILFPDRPILMLEFKDKNTPVTIAQKKVHRRLIEKGFSVHIMRDLDIAIETVKQWRNATVARKKEPESGLVRRGQMVFRRNAKGEYDCLRKATEADAGIPML